MRGGAVGGAGNAEVRVRRARAAGPRAEPRTAFLRDVAEDEPPAGERSASEKLSACALWL